MARFKKGDRVRCLYMEGNYGDKLTVGQVYTVHSLDEDWIYVEENDAINSYETKCFELVTESESELERLVRKTNEGAEALTQLAARYLDSVEYRIPTYENNWRPIGYRHKAEFRVKPKPCFEPFYVGDSWKVRLHEDDRRLHVGCKAYDLKGLLSVLTSIGEMGGNCTLGRDEFRATRNGIKDLDDNEITWEEADRIVEALSRVGKVK